MDNACRLCRKLEPNFPESIHNARNGKIIADIIMKVCPIGEIYTDDGLPDKICDECLEVLLSAYELQKVSIESDNFYRQRLVEPDILVKQEDPEVGCSIKFEYFSDDETSHLPDHDAFSAHEEQFGTSIDYSQINRTVKMTREGTLKTVFNPRPIPGASKVTHADKYYACNFCDVKLKPRNNMLRHMIRHDPIKRPFACKFCLQRFDSDEKREAHEYNMHMNETTTKIIVCELCGATGDHQKGMDDHKLDDHKQSEKKTSRKRDLDEVNLTRRRDDRFHPRQLPGQEMLKYEDTWYACNFCDKQLKPRKNILRHIKLKHDPESLPFGCTICVERFKTPENLDLHEREKHNDDDNEPATIICEICGISGNSAVGMENHKADDHSFRPYGKVAKLEESAEVKFPEALPRMRGVDLFHPRPLPGQESLKYEEIWYACNFCDKQMKPRKSLMRHMRLKHHPKNFPFGCRFCIERFDSEEKLKSHVKTLHKRRCQPSMMFCDVCDVSGDNREGMENHMIDDHTKSLLASDEEKVSKRLQCRACDIRFGNKRALDDHKSELHAETTKCKKCSDMFSNRLELRNHVITHDELVRMLDLDEIQHNIVCCACKKNFDSEHALLKHSNIHSFGYEPVKCEHVSKPLINFNVFYKHVKHHSKPKTHQCLKCMKLFPLDTRLFDHLNSHRRHTARKKLSCDKCDSKFRTRHDLDIHDKIKHQDETLFICKGDD